MNEAKKWEGQSAANRGRLQPISLAGAQRTIDERERRSCPTVSTTPFGSFFASLPMNSLSIVKGSSCPNTRVRRSSRALRRASLWLAASLTLPDGIAQSVYTTPATISTFAGLATVNGATDGTGSEARFNTPNGVAVDSSGNVYVADTTNHTIRKITPAGEVSTLAGSAGASGFANGTSNEARFNRPYGLTLDSSNNLYVADTYNFRVRKISPTGVVTTVAGSGGFGTGDGSAAAASFGYLWGIAIDRNGEIFVVDSGNTIRRIRSDGFVSTFVGSPNTVGNTDGTGSAARFNFNPGAATNSVSISFSGVTIDRDGNFYVADNFNHSIRKITPAGVVTTLAGGLATTATGSTDGIGSAARFRNPGGVAVDGNGNVFVADQLNYLIRKITSAGLVSTVAGSAQSSGTADGTGNLARFRQAYGIAVNTGGDLYIADTFNHTIRTGVFRPAFTTQPTNQAVIPGATATFSANVVSAVEPVTYQWRKDGVAIPGATGTTLTINDVQAANVGSYTLVVTNPNGTTISNAVTLTLRVAPSFTVQPTSRSVLPGSGTTFTATVTGTAPITYQWRRDDVAIPGATATTLNVNNIQAANLGAYTLVATNALGSVTSNPAILSFAVSTAGRLTNLSIRTNAGTGAQTLIVGFVIGGTGTAGTKPLLIRGVGPTLGVFGVPGFLADPALSVISGGTVVALNDNWAGNAQVTTIGTQVGAFAFSATTSRDAALYSPALAAGPYTAQVAGVGGTTGITLAEIYDATPVDVFLATTPRLTNVSARSQVGTGADILITGFNIGGATARRLLIRAVGPTLGVFGVEGFLADPRLDLLSGTTIIQANDNWGGTAAITTAANSVGAFALDGASRDAVLLVTLQPGSYTAQVSGVGNTTGVALVEIYDAP